MSTALSLQFAPGSMEKLQRSVQKRQALLNEDMRKTMTKTSMKVLVALRASAKVAPKRRIVAETPNRFSPDQRKESWDLQQKIQEYYKQHGTPEHKRKPLPMSRYIPAHLRAGWEWAALKSRFQGESVLLPIVGSTPATTRNEAMKSNQAQIKKRGLARASFGWMMGELGGGDGGGTINRMAGVTSVVKDQSGPPGNKTLSLKMTNRLKYIISSLQGGKRDVATALQRARAMLIGETHESVKRMIRRKAAV